MALRVGSVVVAATVLALELLVREQRPDAKRRLGAERALAVEVLATALLATLVPLVVDPDVLRRALLSDSSSNQGSFATALLTTADAQHHRDHEVVRVVPGFRQWRARRRSVAAFCSRVTSVRNSLPVGG